LLRALKDRLHVNSSHSYLLRALKDRLHVNSSHSLQKFKYCIQRETAGISRLLLL